MDFSEALKHLKQGKIIARDKKSPNVIYSPREMYRFDSSFGIVTYDNRPVKFSHVDVLDENWAVVDPEKLVPYSEEYTNTDGTLFEPAEAPIDPDVLKLKAENRMYWGALVKTLGILSSIDTSSLDASTKSKLESLTDYDGILHEAMKGREG